MGHRFEAIEIGASEMDGWQTEGLRTRKVEKEPNKRTKREKKMLVKSDSCVERV